MISVPMIAIIDLYLFFIVSLWCILFGNIAFSVIFRLSVAFIRTRWSVGRIPVVSAVSVLVSVVALASLFLLPVLIVVRSLLAVVGFVFFGILLLAVAILAVALGAWNVYLICTAAGEILTANGYAALAAKGVTVWKLFLVTSAATSVFMLLALVPILLVIAGILVIGTAIAMLVGAILYMIFLYNAYHALLYGR